MSRRIVRLAIGCGAACFVGCSTSGSRTWQGSIGPKDTGETHGTFDGHELQVKSAIGAELSYVNGNSELLMILSDQPNLCGTLIAGHQPSNARYLTLDVVRSTPPGYHAPTVPGTFAVLPFSSTPPAGLDATIQYYMSSSSCGGLDNALTQGVSGTMELTSVSSTDWQGRATFETDAGESDAIAFHATICNPQSIYDWFNQTLPCQ